MTMNRGVGKQEKNCNVGKKVEKDVRIPEEMIGMIEKRRKETRNRRRKEGRREDVRSRRLVGESLDILLCICEEILYTAVDGRWNVTA